MNELDEFIKLVPKESDIDTLYLSSEVFTRYEDLIIKNKYKGYTVVVEKEAPNNTWWASEGSKYHK